MPWGGGAKGSAVSAAVGGGDDDILFPLFIARGEGSGRYGTGFTTYLLNYISFSYFLLSNF